MTENIKGDYAVDGFPNNSNIKGLWNFGFLDMWFLIVKKRCFVLLDLSLL